MNATNTTNTTTSTKAATISPKLLTAQLAALILMIAGWTWTAGNFAQPQEPLAADILTDFLHALPAILLVIFGLRYFGAIYGGLLRSDGATVRRRGSYIVIGVVAFFGAFVMTALGLILSLTGVTNSNPNSVGIHTLDDAIPAVIQISGSLLWLALAFVGRRRAGA